MSRQRFPARAVLRRGAARAVIMTLVVSCGPSPSSAPPSGRSSPEPSPSAGSTAPAPAPARADATRRAPDLSWDSSVGWERRVVFPPGVTSMRRQEWVDYANLRYLMWDEPAVAVEQLGTARDLGSMALVLPHERLCEPALRDGLARAAPEQLLLSLTGDPTPAEWDCLGRIAPPDLYLGLCPDDSLSMSPCDADAQLDALSSRDGLRQRVRGLAVGPGEARHWATLATFPRLSMLTVRGPIVREPIPLEVKQGLCALPDLAYVDLLDASQPGSNPQLPVDCALGLETYEAWYLLDGDPEWGVPPTPVPDTVPCRLRRVMLWSADEQTRQVLSRCKDLELELVDPD